MYAPRWKILEEKGDRDIFIETGTYKGETAEWASLNFKNVFTIEASELLFKPNDKFHIYYFLGDSRDVLKEIAHNTFSRVPCVFWLDGHWFDHGENVAGTEEDCPLLEELAIIMESDQDHVIFIDDAHLIKEKHERYLSWPTLQEILDVVGKKYIYQYVENTLMLKRSL